MSEEICSSEYKINNRSSSSSGGALRIFSIHTHILFEGEFGELVAFI